MKRKLNPPQNNPEGKFKSRRRTGAARSCQISGKNRPKPTSGTGVLLGTARPCHVARPGPATWLVGRASSVFIARLAIGVSIHWDFCATLFRGFKLASLVLLYAKCYSSFHFFDIVPENIKRRYMSKKHAKGGRFNP